VGAPPYRDPVYEPFWAAAQDLDFPVALHIITGRVPDPFHFHTHKEQDETIGVMLQLYYEAMAPLASDFIFGGVLDRFPKLEVCLPHAGGAMPYLMGRLTHGQRVRPETKGVAKKPFQAYLRRFTYDTIAHSPHLLRFLVDTVGADRVMLGSDYCFDMGYTRPVDAVTKHAKLNRADQRRILGATAARLLRLG